MAGGAVAEAAGALRAWAQALAEASEDPAAEILALVWGPRFDREHAMALLARLPAADRSWVHALHAFGEQFDALPAACQSDVRRQIRHIADNAACRASC